MITPKTIEEVRQLIIDREGESISLEYKSADILIKNLDINNVCKAVSAMANSAGGTVIFGIAEFQEKDKRHLPEKITPIELNEFPRERLEQIISSNISPKIDGLLVHPIPINAREVVYVVEVPQSNTAHQNTKDHKYYKRHNFMSEPMLDYEIRDVMNRQKHPIIELQFEIAREYDTEEYYNNASGGGSKPSPEIEIVYNLYAYPVNKSDVLAKHVCCFVTIPNDILYPIDDKDVLVREFCLKNINNSSSFPILPGLYEEPLVVRIYKSPNRIEGNNEISWRVHADNSQVRVGKVELSHILYFDKEPEA